MRSSLSLYRAVKRELDLYEAAAFSVQDFNYYYNRAQREVISQSYKIKSISAEAYRDCQSLLTFKVLFSQAAGVYELPDPLPWQVESYETRCRDEKDRVLTRAAEVLLPEHKSSVEKDPFRRPCAKRPYYQVMESLVHFFVGEDTLEEVKCYYLQQPEKVWLDPDETKRSDSMLPEATEEKVIRASVRMFLEAVESQRYQTQLIDHQKSQ
jgi:hypothetical protein